MASCLVRQVLQAGTSTGDLKTSHSVCFLAKSAAIVVRAAGGVRHRDVWSCLDLRRSVTKRVTESEQG